MNSLAETAAVHVRESARYYREARRDARWSAGFYAAARSCRDRACSGQVMNAADYERSAVVFTRTGDMYLAAAFRATDHARFYARLARDYLAMGVPAAGK